MKKKLLIALLSSLTISGLLVWSTNAMEYVVQWDSTQIAIPDNIEWTTIQWCSDCAVDTITTTLTWCWITTIQLKRYIQCSHDYDTSGEYIVTFDGNDQRFSNLYLSDSKIKRINNFSRVRSITNLYLTNNKDIILSTDTFDSIPIVNIYLDENRLTQYDTVLPNNNNELYLNDNLLPTIPLSIWQLRSSYELKLSNTISYKESSSTIKLVDLSDNPIKFAWITDSNYNNYNDNHFERFGYDYENPNNPTYYYQILKNWVEVENTTWTTTDDEIEINTPLIPGDYTFKVCIYWDDVCDYNGENIYDFSVDYNETIRIIDPEEQEYDSMDNIQWERWRSWNYPKSLLSWYSYTITKWSQTIKEWFININDTNESCAYHDCVNWIDIGNIIETELWWNNPNDEYLLTIYLIDKDWYIAKSNSYDIYATRRFSINIIGEPATVNIIQPASEVSSQTVAFERNHFFPTSSYHTYNFLHYEYTVKKWNTPVTWNNNTNDTSFTLKNLEDGTYTFEVILHYTDNSESKTATGTKTFSMTASEAPHINITSPTSWSTITEYNSTTTSIPFTWDGWATLFYRYHYTLKDNSNNELTWWDITINDENHRQFSYNLWNGSYTFEVEMYNSSEILIASDSSEFTVNIPTTLNIISPLSGDNSSPTTVFSWEWFTPYTFTDYEYTITWPNWFSIPSTRTGGTSFSLQNLRDGPYEFTVTMNYKEWATPKTITEVRNFTINTSSWANIDIISPNKAIYTWNYEKTVLIDFSWNWWGSPLISSYAYNIYKLWNDDIYHIVKQGSEDKNASWSYSISPQSLSGGTYKFEVIMLDNESEPIIPPKTHIFNVTIPPHLNIITPWQNDSFSGQQNINFSRSWFAEFDNYYHYKWSLTKTKNSVTTTTWNTINMINMEITWLQLNLSNGMYNFVVSIMSGSTEIISGSRSFSILDPIDLQVYVSDWDTSVTTLRSSTWTFVWNGKSEDFSWYYYYISWTNFKNESFYTWGTSWELTGSITLTDLSTWKYRFWVNMLNSNNEIITWKYIDFNVSTLSSITITQPTSWSSISSSNVTFSRIWESDILRTWYSTDEREYRYELLKINDSWNTQILPRQITNANSFSHNFTEDGTYKFIVRLYSWGTMIANNSSTFSLSIPKRSSWGGGWGYSSKSHQTNNLSVSITNDEPTTNERIEVVVDVNDKYTGKVDFTKMQYYSTKDGERIDIPVTSKNYVSDYSDDAKLGYVKFKSSDNWEKEISEFMKFSQNGNYRIYVKDEDWYSDYVQFYIWKWSNATKSSTNTTVKSSNYIDSDTEVFIARSCKKYTITYSSSLNVYTSPNLNMSEYFINKDYFKRYIDSKNRYQEGCPKNLWWISTSYYDKTNDNNRYTAPNGKVYFITWQEWNYYSNELNKELKSPTSFSTIQQLKYYIRDRNPLINMATLWPIN